jgi:hypothetical protein
MAKKKRQRASQTSKGIHGTTRNRNTDPAQRMLNKVRAWRAGKPVKILVETPNSNERFIKMDAQKIWGDPNPKRKDESQSTE